MTRKQQILKRFPKYWKILFIEPVVLGKKTHFIPKRENNIYIVTIPYLRGSNKNFLSKFIFNNGIVSVFIKTFGELIALFWIYILGFSGKDKVVALSSIHWGDFASKLKAKVKFYDCNDDHLKFAENCPWAREYLSRYLKTCDFVICVSKELNRRVQSIYRVKSCIVGNGVDYEHFSKPVPKAPDLAEISGKILGFAGAIKWLDIELLEMIAKRFDNHNIVLIGPVIEMDLIDEIHRLAVKYRNVYYLGEKSYDLLPSYIQYFDVGLLPYIKNEYSETLNPGKLYQYLAAGIPIVTMDFSKDIREFSEIIYIAKGKKEFIESIKEALKSGFNPKGREIAKWYDWKEVSNKFLKIIRNFYKSY